MIGFPGLWCAAAVLLSCLRFSRADSFTYNNRSFLLNGQPYQIFGGQMDPQRIPPQYWQQRLQMARAMGLNTIFSYIFWNNLEPVPGQWDFSGRNDIAEYFRIAQQEGLNVVLRPGPYICGEHDWGGFPAWLSQVPGMAVRQNNGPFLDASAAYLARLGEELRGLLAPQGGPILMVQVENEYGSFGSDQTYLAKMVDLLRGSFRNITLYTNDGGGQSYLEGGAIKGILAETDGSPQAGFAARDNYTDPSSRGPQLDGEYYVTWIDQWAADHAHETDSGNAAAMQGVLDDLEYILKGNNSFSLYMFHGGTNWGYENGGIWSGGLLMAVTTSYDYGAPLDESGRPTEIYYKIRALLAEYSATDMSTSPDVPQPGNVTTIPETVLHPVAGLLDLAGQMSPSVVSQTPVTMEALGQSCGFVLYTHTATSTASGLVGLDNGARDRVLVLVNGERAGVIDSTYATPAKISVSLSKGDVLQLLVENLGRVDYSTRLIEQAKGILGNVTLDGDVVTGWSTHGLPLHSVPEQVTVGHTSYTVQNRSAPVFYRGRLLSSATHADDGGLGGDTFLSLPDGVKGVAWVNGILLGRFWTVGPQQSLYLPGAYLRQGNNDVVVLELEPEPDVVFRAEGISERQWFNNADPDV